jgi:hypothetical protein
MADTKKAGDAGEREVSDQLEAAMKRGYIGDSPTAADNQAFSLQSGPESPSPLEQEIKRHEQAVSDLRRSTAKGS